jgi:hypothetical protein
VGGALAPPAALARVRSGAARRAERPAGAPLPPARLVAPPATAPRGSFRRAHS